MKKSLFVIACAVLALSGCGRDDTPAESAPAATAPNSDGVTPGTAAIAPADPSLPNSGVVGSTPTHPEMGQDTVANSPDGEMTKREESQAMPQPGQVNNYSTTARDAVHGTGNE